MRTLKRLVWLGFAAMVVVAFVVDVEWLHPGYVLAPLLGLVILRLGWATFGSLAGGGMSPDDEPQPVDPSQERVRYWCEGCGAELLLLVRGTATPPRHCGERMHERHEVVHGPN